MLTLRDLRYAIRALGQAPGRTLLLVLTSPSASARTPPCSVLSALSCCGRCRYRISIAMVSVWKTKPFNDNLLSEPSYPGFEAWQSERASFDGMAAMSSVNLTFTWQAPDQPQTLAGRVVSENSSTSSASASPGTHVHGGGGRPGTATAS